MKTLFVGMIAFLNFAILYAQSSFPSTDYGGALLTLKDTTIFLGNGFGMQELNSQEARGCLLQGEHNTVWVEIRIADSIPENSVFTFELHPLSNETDLDFAVYGPNVTCGDLGTPIRCTYADQDFANTIGLSVGETDVEEGSGGNGFLKPLDVHSGERYFLLIDEFETEEVGFELAWGEEMHENGLLNDSDCYHSIELPQSFDVCQGKSFQIAPLVYNGSQSFEYEWMASLESLETSVQDSLLTVTPSGDFLGEIIFQLVVSDTEVEDCQKEEFVTVHVIALEDCANTAENPLLPTLQFYPNPAHDFLQISLTSPPMPAAASLQCYNAQGQLMHQEQVDIGGNKQSHLLEVVDFPEGVYYVHLRTDGGVVVEKVLVVR